MTTPTAPTRTAVAVRIGLVLAALLSIVDLIALVATEHGDTTGTVVAVCSAVLAVATLAALPAAVRGAGWALRTVAATRLVACLASMPVFFDDNAEEPVIVAAITVLLAVTVAVLVLLPARARI